MAEGGLDDRWERMLRIQGRLEEGQKALQAGMDGFRREHREDLDRLHKRIDETDKKHMVLSEAQESKAAAAIEAHVAKDHQRFDKLETRLGGLEERRIGEDAVRESDRRRQKIRIAFASVGLGGLLTWLATHVWPFTK